ncbi:MAG TPA: hypothetical protein VMV12_02265 [Candidatus Micrarchaeaceae archaeon]|nr:hypothetical protein [Candidatus Micrarchaeaceae archaeon]
MERSAVAVPRGSRAALALPFAGLILAVALTLSATGCGSSPTPNAGLLPQASAGTSCRLTVSITSSLGRTWGTVTATSGGTSFTFGRATRSVSIPCGATVELAERPTDSNSWSFLDWRVGDRTAKGTTASTVVNGSIQVSAVYVLAAPSTGPPTPSASGN